MIKSINEIFFRYDVAKLGTVENNLSDEYTHEAGIVAYNIVYGNIDSKDAIRECIVEIFNFTLELDVQVGDDLVDEIFDLLNNIKKI